MVGDAGFEPATPAVWRQCSPAELIALKKYLHKIKQLEIRRVSKSGISNTFFYYFRVNWIEVDPDLGARVRYANEHLYWPLTSVRLNFDSENQGLKLIGLKWWVPSRRNCSISPNSQSRYACMTSGLFLRNDFIVCLRCWKCVKNV